MKKQILISVIVLVSAVLNAQDKIYQADGKVIEGKIYEVGTYEIRYKKTSNPDGPLYSIPRSYVLRIAYENGTEDVLNSVQKSSGDAGIPSKPAFKRQRVIGIDFFQMYYGNVSVFIERMKSPVYSMRFTWYGNFKPEMSREEFPIMYGFSVNPKFNVYYHKNVRVFLGQSFHWGFSLQDLTRQGYFQEYVEEDVLSFHEMSIWEAGVSINPVKNLDITLNGGAGFVSSIKDLGGDLETNIGLAWRIGISVGGKF